MILDTRLQLCDATPLPLGAASTAYTIGDLVRSRTVRDIGNGKPVYCIIKVVTPATSGGSAAAQFWLCSDAQDPMVAASATVHVETASFGLTNVLDTDNTTLAIIPLPPESDVTTYEAYFGLVVYVSTASFTAGAISAWLTTDPNVLKTYADAGN